MKCSATALLAILAAYTQAQSLSLPSEGRVSSIVGEATSRAGDIASNVSTRVEDISTRAGDLSSRINSITNTHSASASGATETVTGTKTESKAVNTSDLARASSAVEDRLASLSSDLADAAGTASQAIQSKIDQATSELGAIASSATATDNIGAMPTAAVAMGALMGGAAVFANM
ncbi:hypothetical protein FOPG_18677 [Fusarium oxysporum f. sp. conglutinans race 2 54008]|uniref:Vegetative incompatibility protein HET-E-1 n=5 Tax=Fusarium oxysporum TaxID=5507 RepID=A0A8H6H297_FUSOX|nr:hypothetical protein FOXB_02523 [Fusarium oxysporum f. sp. conglutinans Fo5176]EXA30961.1 hypothetical protein FOVG_17690 [Fusarium oxysporum f. sp. pisi HDV247]EXL65085.1 hypothetical protein FOPG_18677 [Fusarium oxysporum f. sp. conglutinans race 2 54008]KAF6527775.1 hypothetical protein HZS61_008077 [Fusarium oxysporum f. sp. conglutinans]KAH7463393.1 hypothetical protein FOMA001_g18102 [Fusarium oxysporum f. sp. matthiolae]KAI8417125.1 hypothetical protein FOFC_03438 [Fusarium oxysporum